MSECLHHINGAGFLIVWLQVFDDTFRTHNKEPAPFFLLCLQRQYEMEVYEYLFKSDFIDYPNQLKTKQWEEKRNRILNRDNHRCQICGKGKSKWTRFNDKFYNVGIEYNCSSNTVEDIVSANLSVSELKSLIQAKVIKFIETSSGLCVGVSDNGILGIMDSNTGNALKSEFIPDNVKFNFIRHESGMLYYFAHLKDADLSKIKLEAPYWTEYPRFLNVHHKHYIIQHKAWEYEDDDLVTLCNECHTKVHKAIGAPVYSDENGYMKEVHLTPCYRCQGTGYFPEYKHVENGICFRCSGARFEEFIQHASNQDNIISKEDLPF